VNCDKSFEALGIVREDEPDHFVDSDGFAISEEEFVARVESSPNPYLQKSLEYQHASHAFIMKNGSGKLRKQIGQVQRGERLTLSPRMLAEISDLGKLFDQSWNETLITVH